MCFARPSAPQIVYSGPSQEDIARQQQQLQLYMQQSAAQQEQFAAQLQQQIDQANRAATQQRRQLEAERQMATANTTAQQQAAYSVSTSMSDPVAAITTEPIQPRKKPTTATLAITPGGVETMAGSGLNIGI